MSEPFTISIRTDDEQAEPAGFDSSIITVPDGWYSDVGLGLDARALVVQLAGKQLRQISERQAADLGEILHHANWAITGDPEQVRTLGLMHDCPTCRAGVDQALAYLDEHEDGEVAVGQLYWAAQ